MKFLADIDRYFYITAAILLGLGIALTFFGYKVYKIILIVVTFLTLIVFSIYLYAFKIEGKSFYESEYSLSLVLLGLLLATFIGFVLFMNLIWIMLAGFISSIIGLMISLFLTLLTGIIFFLFAGFFITVPLFVMFLYLFAKYYVYFMVFSTAVIGSELIMIGLPYFYYTRLDFFLEWTIDWLGGSTSVLKTIVVYVFMYLALVIAGCIV